MKKIIVILAITFMGQLVFAQLVPSIREAKGRTSTELNKTKMEKRGHHKKDKHKREAMIKELNLSEDQKAKLKEMKASLLCFPFL